MPWEPAPYMLAAARFLLENPEAALFLDPGLRKTSITLAAFKVLLGEGLARRMLVVAPPRVCRSVWPKEAAKWADFASLRVLVLHGPRKDELLLQDADVYCVSYEGLEWLMGVTKQRQVQVGRYWIDYNAEDLPREGDAVQLRGNALRTLKALQEAAQELGVGLKAWRSVPERERALLGAAAASLGLRTRRIVKTDLTKFKALGADVLCLDELSKMKHTNTARHEALAPALPLFKRRWGLTGSPHANGLMNLFGQMLAIDCGKSLGSFITHFRRQFFFPTGYGGYTWVPQEGAEQRIYERIAPYAFRLRAEDYMKLPDLVVQRVEVELPPEARRVYDELEQEFIALLEGDELATAANTGAARIKCKQVANGGLYLDREADEQGRMLPRRKQELHTAKVEAVRDLVEEFNGAPCIVTYEFEHDLVRLKKEFKDAPHIGGGVSPRESERVLEAWNRNEVPVLLAHFAAMAHGINAQEGNACRIVCLALTEDYELYDQLVRRLRRSGNKAAHVFVYHVIAADTVDEVMEKLLTKKENAQLGFFEAMSQYTKARYGRALKQPHRPTKSRLAKSVPAN